jgi:hypothetical protein
LEGDFLDLLPEIVRARGRQPVGEVQHFTGWASAAPFARRKNHSEQAWFNTLEVGR